MALKFLYAKFASRCHGCSEQIARHSPIWHDPAAHRNYHEKCKPGDAQSESVPVPPPPTEEAKSEKSADECVEPGCTALADYPSTLCWKHRQTPTEEPKVVPVPTPPPVVVSDSSAVADQLAHLLTQLAAQSMNEDKVRAIVKEALDALPPPGERIVAHTFQVGDAPPTTEKNPHRKLPELIRRMSKPMANGRRPYMWLHGPTGSGKTEGAAMMARALDAHFEYIPCHDALTAHELFGYLQPDGVIVETPLTRALMVANEGRNAVFLLDEVTVCGNSITCANALTSNGHIPLPGRGMVAIPPTFWLVVADNTTGRGATAEYSSRQKCDDSFLNRFGFMKWDYDTDMERNALDNHPVVGKLQAVRAFCAERKLKAHITLRQMQMMAVWLSSGVSEQDALEDACLAGLSPDSAQAVREYYSKL